jgi:hypothetical protein
MIVAAIYDYRCMSLIYEGQGYMYVSFYGTGSQPGDADYTYHQTPWQVIPVGGEKSTAGKR